MKGRVIDEEKVNGKMGMRIMVGLVPILVVMILWVTSKSSQIFLSSHLFVSPHLIFSIFNSIILLITMRNHEPHPREQFEIMELTLQLSPYHKPHQDIEFSACDQREDTREEDEDEDKNVEYGNKNEKEDEFNDEDEIKQLNEKEHEDEDNDRDEVGDEEEDEELEKRIEEFIAKVNKRWREEKLRDHLLIQICSNNVSSTSN
ncbi:glutamic acid-rich protein-like [Benincasa hispida]|uniref:glutamic acid-rich protein-like n=1 Tax=Benincasa hispida TaxID=102211 RepID=UPI001901456B|nr:glutamic acid-rich protein-like [Benincasa hispida]